VSGAGQATLPGGSAAGETTRLALLGGALRATVDEMDTVLKLSAFSPVIAEGNDRASGVFNAETGGVIAQGIDGLPAFVGNMQFVVHHVLETIPDLREGDVVIVNDPYECGTHLMDVKLVAPFFWEGRLELFLANTGHWSDVGGAVPGGFSARATEVYQEGVRITPLRLYAEGELNAELLELLMTNMRVPGERLGDLEAQLGALEKGRQRLVEIFERFGAEGVRSGAAAIADRCERAMRDRIAALPDGTYEFEDFLDNDGITDEPLPIRLAFTVAGEEMTFDFTGSAPACRGPMNNPANNTKSSCLIALKHVFPEIPINEGAFRPVNFVIPEESFLSARFPSPTSGSSAEVCQRIIDVCFGAFAESFPSGTYAQPFSTSANLSIGGFDPDSGERYVVYIYLGGGLGAHDGGDGLSNATAAHSTARVAPMEIIERSYPFRVRRYSLRDGSAGPGRNRGGLGIVLELELLRGEASVAIVADRTRQGPRGFAGGGEALPARYRFRRGDGEEYEPPLGGKDQDVRLLPGDRILVETPGGGGWGPAEERSPRLVAADAENGYLQADERAAGPGTEVGDE
jgi:N-methylhydantoinase B